MFSKNRLKSRNFKSLNNCFKSFNMLIEQISFILDDIFYDPRISRIEKILVKICPIFLDIYTSTYGIFMNLRKRYFVSIFILQLKVKSSSKMFVLGILICYNIDQLKLNPHIHKKWQELVIWSTTNSIQNYAKPCILVKLVA